MKLLIPAILVSAVFLASCHSIRNVREPEYRDIRDMHLVQAGPLQSSVALNLIYYNPNHFGLQLNDARGEIYINNVYFGRFELDRPVQVRRFAEFTLPATVKVDMIGAIKNQRDLLHKKEALVKIVGTARVRKAGLERELPINYEKVENIERFRSIVAM